MAAHVPPSVGEVQLDLHRHGSEKSTSPAFGAVAAPACAVPVHLTVTPTSAP